jgi:hypothetical protein
MRQAVAALQAAVRTNNEQIKQEHEAIRIHRDVSSLIHDFQARTAGMHTNSFECSLHMVMLVAELKLS